MKNELEKVGAVAAPIRNPSPPRGTQGNNAQSSGGTDADNEDPDGDLEDSDGTSRVSPPGGTHRFTGACEPPSVSPPGGTHRFTGACEPPSVSPPGGTHRSKTKGAGGNGKGSEGTNDDSGGESDVSPPGGTHR